MGDNDDLTATTSDGDESPTSTLPEVETLSGDDAKTAIDGDSGTGLDEPTSSEPTSSRRKRGAGKRLGGFLALILGVAGLLASIAGGFLVMWAGFTATSKVDSLVAPLRENVDRLETRVNQADDAVDRDGIDADRMPELRARAEGLADVALSAQELATGLDEHPIYRWLPADLEPLTNTMDDYASRATTINDLVAGVEEERPLTAGTATEITNGLNSLQDEVDDVGDIVDRGASSLTRWIRIGSLIGVLVSVWSGWAQFCLTRRGLRGLRGAPV